MYQHQAHSLSNIVTVYVTNPHNTVNSNLLCLQKCEVVCVEVSQFKMYFYALKGKNQEAEKAQGAEERERTCETGRERDGEGRECQCSKQYKSSQKKETIGLLAGK